MVGLEEIEKNGFNLNLPRYIDSQEPEDIQDIEGHCNGGIPQLDVDALGLYWAICPTLRQTLFKDNRPGYLTTVNLFCPYQVPTATAGQAFFVIFR